MKLIFVSNEFAMLIKKDRWMTNCCEIFVISKFIVMENNLQLRIYESIDMFLISQFNFMISSDTTN